MQAKIAHVPTNILTGFLGTGKTSAIQHLLSFKPENERWAILVNEFGTVGIDGAIYQNAHKDDGGVFIREVPGGCMCCVSGLPMQIALNVLLKRSNPHRLLIEPSGLGHPLEVVSLLKSKYYKDVLDIQKIITLIDPQQFIQNRYFDHPTYQQQLEIADICMVNKTDKCSDQELHEFKCKYKAASGLPIELLFTVYGRAHKNLLSGNTDFPEEQAVAVRETVNFESNADIDLSIIPVNTGYLMSSRSDEGFHAISWRYLKNMLFHKAQILNWLKTIKAERIKATLNTHEGALGINSLQGDMQVFDIETCDESRLEIITTDVNPDWDSNLNDCLVAKAGLGKIKAMNIIQ